MSLPYPLPSPSGFLRILLVITPNHSTTLPYDCRQRLLTLSVVLSHATAPVVTYLEFLLYHYSALHFPFFLCKVSQARAMQVQALRTYIGTKFQHAFRIFFGLCLHKMWYFKILLDIPCTLHPYHPLSLSSVKIKINV